MPAISAHDNDNPTLTIATDKVAFIILKARAVDAKNAPTDENGGSNPTGDRNIESLEDISGDFRRRELADAIDALNEDEQINLVALAWLGRSTYDIGEWQIALDTACREHNGRTARYLLGLPLLGDYLEQGLAQFGESINDEGAID